jgi:hypothetical protein
MSNLLSYGMIIKIIAPDNDILHNKDFFISFINNEKIILLNKNDEEILRIVDKKIQDETIKEIQILSEPREQGYIKQNNLNIKTWIDIYFNGTIPVVITGQIINIEEDMIELKTYPDKDVIYIDFKYQGIPEELNIDKIVIRSSPKEDEKTKIVDDKPGIEDETEMSEKSIKELIDNKDLNETELEEVDILEEGEILEEEELNNILLDADKIDLLEDLDEIEYIVDVDDDKQRYSIKEQENDLLDSLLEKIPTNERTDEKLKQIHLLINRFKQLREKTSIFDENLNVTEIKTIDDFTKPIVETILNDNHNVKYLLKIVQNNKKIYDYDQIPSDIDDVVKVKLCDDRMSEFDIIQKYKTNFFSDKENPIQYINELLSYYYRPFENRQNTNLEVKCKKDEDVIINNDENYCNIAFTIKSSLDSLNKVCFNQQRYLKNETQDIKSILFMPYPFIKYSNVNIPNISILDKTNLTNIELFLYKIFQDININTTIIDKNTDVVTDKNHLNMVTEFSFTSDQEFKYPQILQKIVPSTNQVIEIMEEYLKETYSLYGALTVLSVFYIDIDNLRDAENMLIQSIIIKNIERFILENQKLSKLSRQIKYIKKKKQSNLISQISSTSLKESVFSIYKIDPNIKITSDYTNTISNSELLYRMCFDNWSVLNNSILESSIDLFNPFTSDKIQEIYEKANSKIDMGVDNDCKETIIAKKYTSIEELERDNDKTIYFDKIYDPTFYDIKEEYLQEQENMDYGDFKNFLIKELMKNVGLNKEAAEIEAKTMIDGKKEVSNGYYALLEFEDNSEKVIYYYKRDKNKWIRDKTITEGVMIDKNKLLCNIKENCFQEGDDCKDMSSHSDMQNINKIINEYNDIGNLDKE